jgi:hypothetical protein
MTLFGYILIAVSCYLCCVTTYATQESDDLISFLQQYAYLENTMTTPADKVFYGAELSEADLDVLDNGDELDDGATEPSFSEASSTSLIDLDEGEEEGEEGGNVCPPLVSQFCRPCYKFHSDITNGPCGKWKSVCEKMFCEPLCRRELWSVSITVAEGADPDFKADAESDSIRLGLESYFLQYGCGDILGCCTPTPGNNYLELHAYQGEFPRLGTVEKCRGMSSKEKAQQLCEGQVTVEVKPIEGACAKFSMHSSTKTFDAAYERTGLKAATPYHGAMRQRCDELQKKIKEKTADMQAKFQKMVCPCMGCGDHKQCPLSLSFGVLPVSYTEFPGSDLGDYILQPSRQ